MKRVNRTPLLVVATWLVAAAAACGESESAAPPDDSSTAEGGSSGTTHANGGTGGTADPGPRSTMCGETLCQGLSLGIPGGPQTDACCPEDGSSEPCGVETSFLADYDFELARDCQPLNRPGTLDESCPESPPLVVSSLSLAFPGCCLPAGKCGFLLDSVLDGAIPLNLGCIDVSELPNADVQEPPDCEPSTNAGQAGAGGAE